MGIEIEIASSSLARSEEPCKIKIVCLGRAMVMKFMPFGVLEHTGLYGCLYAQCCNTKMLKCAHLGSFT